MAQPLFSNVESQRLQSFLDQFDRPEASTSSTAANGMVSSHPAPPPIQQQLGTTLNQFASRTGAAGMDEDRRREQTDALSQWLAAKGFSPNAPSSSTMPQLQPAARASISHPPTYGLVTPSHSQHSYASQSQNSFGSPRSPPRAFAPAPAPIVKTEPEEPHEQLAAAKVGPSKPRKRKTVEPKASRLKASESNAEAGPSRTANGLLTEEQKRANHIASEQKRRAAIRQGYDALCDVVPALRAAVQEFEDRLAITRRGRGMAEDDADEMDVKGKRKRTADGSGALTGGINVGDEKIDGRAGPKSEAVVLAKSVEYLKETKQRRADLLTRLEQVQAIAAQRGVQIPPAPTPWLDPAEDTN